MLDHLLSNVNQNKAVSTFFFETFCLKNNYKLQNIIYDELIVISIINSYLDSP